MLNNEPTRLTLESYSNKIQWESPHSDASMEDLLYAFYGLCVAATWSPKTILENMRDFAEERLEFMQYKEEEDNTSKLHDIHPYNRFVDDDTYTTSVSNKDYSDSITYTSQSKE